MSGHAHEAYQGIESCSEFEYGFTDDFQESFYLNYNWSRTHAHFPLGPIETSSLPGVSGEFIYRLMNVYFDPIGPALYAEPSIGSGTRSFEVKAPCRRIAGRVAQDCQDRSEKNEVEV